MGVGGQLHAPAGLSPERDPVSSLREAGWAPGPVWTGAENLALTGIRSPDHPARSESLYRVLRMELAISLSNFLSMDWKNTIKFTTLAWNFLYTTAFASILKPSLPSAQSGERDYHPGLKQHISLVSTLRIRGTNFHSAIHLRDVVLN